MDFIKDYNFIHRYFIGEKQESLLFLIIGAIAVVLAAVFYFGIKTNPAFFSGVAIPLIAIGIIQIVVGYTVYSRSDKQRIDVAYKAGTDPQFIRTAELPRMEKVMKNFVIYRYTEIVLALVGVGLALYFRNNESMFFWKGIGFALGIQALVMLTADNFAERRAEIYINGLENLIKA